MGALSPPIFVSIDQLPSQKAERRFASGVSAWHATPKWKL